MARKDPPSTPENEPADDAASETAATRKDRDDAIDAEIIEERETTDGPVDTDTRLDSDPDEPVADPDRDGTVTTDTADTDAADTDTATAYDAERATTHDHHDGEPPHDRHDGDGHGGDGDDGKKSGGGLAGPFAMIVGAIALVLVVIFFMNRGGDAEDDTVFAEEESGDLLDAEETRVARPIAPIPTPTDAQEPAEPATPPAETETAEADAETRPAEQDVESPAREAAADTDTAAQGESDATDEEATPAERTADATRESMDAEPQRARSALVERARARAARNAPATEAAEPDNVEPSEREETEAGAETDRSEAEETAARVTTAQTADDATETAETTRNQDADNVARADREMEAEEQTGQARTATREDEGEDETVSTETDSSAETDTTVAGMDAESDEAATDDRQTERRIAEARVAGAAMARRDAARESEDLDARINDLKSDVRQEVLAETEQVIDQKFQRTERQVEALRTELTQQQREANERLARLTDRIETIQTSEITQARQSTFLLALADLNEGIESGEPFVRELDNVERIAPNSRALNVLRRYADEGLPTNSELRARYQDAARSALSGAKREEADGPMARFFANMSGLFTVRKVGEVPGDTPSAIIARAESRLESNDLAAAVAELKALEGRAADAFSDWVRDAEARVEAERRIDALEQAVTSRAG
jgi:hypothetical protein